MILSSNLPPDKGDEVSVRRSFFRFVSTTGLCFVFGFISHYFIDLYPLKTVFLEALEVPKTHELEIDKPGLHFRKGLMPVVALGVGKLELKQKKCSMQTLVARDVLVVFRPLSLFFGEFRPKRIYVNDLQINQPQACFFPGVLGTKTSGGSELQDTVSYEFSTGGADSFPVKSLGNWKTNAGALERIWKRIDFPSLKNFFSEISKNLNLHKWISRQPVSIKVREMEFKWIQDLNRQVVLKAGLFVGFRSRDPSVRKDSGVASESLREEHGEIQGHLTLRQLEVKNKKIFMKSDIRFSLGSPGLKLGIDMGLREGKIRGDLEILNGISPLTSLSFKVNKLPVSSLDNFFTPSLHYLWFDCSGELSSSWEELDKKRIEFDNCAFSGPYGSLIFSDIRAGLFSMTGTKIEVNKLNLDRILRDRKSFQLSGVFDSYGVISARGDYFQEKLELRGVLENSRIIFSKNHFRDLQSVSKIFFRVKRDKKQWWAAITDMDVQEGDFQGGFQFEMDEKAGWISGAMNVPSMRLSPAIYRLMLGSEPVPLSLSGRFFWSDRVVKDWFIDMKAPLLKSKTYEIRDLKARGRPGLNGTSQVEISAAGGVFHPDSEWIRWLDATTLDRIWTSGPVNFRDFLFRFKLSGDKSLEWEKWTFRLENGWRFSSHGSRDSKKKIRTHVHWSYPNRPPLGWVYQGELFKGRWQSRDPWINQWLERNGDFLRKHPDLHR